jgi:hypothetical protein
LSLGEAFCKVRILDVPEATREHVTLAWLHEPERTWSFEMSKVHYCAEHDDVYYILLSRVPGGTIDPLWSDLRADRYILSSGGLF